MTVKIEDMNMPDNCRECRFCKYDSCYEEYYCYGALIPLDCTDNCYEHVRQVHCPLKEVK